MAPQQQVDERHLLARLDHALVRHVLLLGRLLPPSPTAKSKGPRVQSGMRHGVYMNDGALIDRKSAVSEPLCEHVQGPPERERGGA